MTAAQQRQAALLGFTQPSWDHEVAKTEAKLKAVKAAADAKKTRLAATSGAAAARVRLNIIGDLSTMLHAWVILTYNFDELITDYRPSNAS